MSNIGRSSLTGNFASLIDIKATKCPTRRNPPENGGVLAAALRLRPSSIHAGIASGSAPAFRRRWRPAG
jgi:hypothetical protein